MELDIEPLLSALALVLVLEGIVPFISPEVWRKAMRALLERSDKSVRFAGLISMLVGVIGLFLIHSGY